VVDFRPSPSAFEEKNFLRLFYMRIFNLLPDIETCQTQRRVVVSLITKSRVSWINGVYICISRRQVATET